MVELIVKRAHFLGLNSILIFVILHFVYSACSLFASTCMLWVCNININITVVFFTSFKNQYPFYFFITKFKTEVGYWRSAIFSKTFSRLINLPTFSENYNRNKIYGILSYLCHSWTILLVHRLKYSVTVLLILNSTFLIDPNMCFSCIILIT